MSWMDGFSLFGDSPDLSLNPADFSLSDQGPSQALDAADYRLDPSGVSTTLDLGGDGGGGGFDWSKIGQGFKDAGGIAKAVMPLLGLGTGIAGTVSSINAMKGAGKAAKTREEAIRTQMESAKRAQDLAPKVEPIAEDLRALADPLTALVPRQTGVADRLRADVATPLTAFGRSTLDLAERGELSPAEQAQIDKSLQAARAQLQDYFARAGLGDSQMLRDALDDLEMEALAMKGGRLDAAKKLGITSLEAGGRATGAESDVLSGAASTYTRAGDVLSRAGQTYGVGGNILGGAGQTAGGAAQSAASEEKMLADLIANVQRQIQALTSGAA